MLYLLSFLILAWNTPSGILKRIRKRINRIARLVSSNGSEVYGEIRLNAVNIH
jgi:hypothetical protein